MGHDSPGGRGWASALLGRLCTCCCNAPTLPPVAALPIACSWQALAVYVAWFGFQVALHLLLPGKERQGVVLPTGERLTYKLTGECEGDLAESGRQTLLPSWRLRLPELKQQSSRSCAWWWPACQQARIRSGAREQRPQAYLQGVGYSTPCSSLLSAAATLPWPSYVQRCRTWSSRWQLWATWASTET